MLLRSYWGSVGGPRVVGIYTGGGEIADRFVAREEFSAVRKHGEKAMHFFAGRKITKRITHCVQCGTRMGWML